MPGQFFNFRKYPRTAVKKSRDKRIKKAEEDAARFEKGWTDNPDIQKVRAFREQEKLQSLKKGLMNDGEEEMNVIWPEKFNKAEDFVSSMSGENGLAERDDEDKEDKDHFWFKGTLLEESKEKKGQEYLTADIPNRLVKKINGFVDLSETEDEDFTLSKVDERMLGNLIRFYNDKSIE